ncbi:DUF3047 domain-containing protein [Profundibacterium mesophilum]|uniref:DUF3047 domain-containing protein n=1 Tax=Profundibacterium mesophilum KAUST100406-0324 TaxID=1037889 RepID=A0A921NZV5_9RHOB|nr:DUF3047 domain-containing protein [Profundibacterium mesophilum]KAF0676598.1 hypothetical protein PMES_01330 [Profundibacterium mesophilum KAUST100406-0324]
MSRPEAQPRRSPALRMALPLAALAGALLAGTPAAAAQIAFSGWTLQKFSLFSKVDFGQQGAVLTIDAQDAASLLWTAVPASDRGRGSAAWDWSVARSVPATDLTRKGGDDRNAAVYFVFLPEAQAAAAAGGSIASLLSNEAARVLVYTWGGAHRRGEMLASPYLGPRGRTVVLRPAGTGRHSEKVSLAKDYAAAFGGAPGALVGVAVSADSDDTDGVIAAQVSGLRLD